MSLMDLVTKAVAEKAMDQLQGGAGINADQAKSMLPMAAAMLMGGMKKNAQNSNGAQALSNALDKHDGSLLDNLQNLAGGDVMGDGQKILGHILGGKQQNAVQALAEAGGVGQGQAQNLLAMAAPMIMGALGKAKREQGFDASALVGMLGQEAQAANQVAQSAAPSGNLGMLAGFLDADGDGDIKDDIAQGIGKKILGGLFGKK